jgi:hypothetical protein
MNRTRDKLFKECVVKPFSTIPDAYLGQLLVSTHERYEYHLDLATKNRKSFRNAHYFLTYTIPIYSAIFTYMASNDIIHSRSTLGLIGLVLTIMTIVASILKPYGHCIAAMQALIDLNTWKTDFIGSLSTLRLEADKLNTKSLYEFLQRKDLEMSKIGAALMDLIPKSSASTKDGE